VRTGRFPGPEESYHLPGESLDPYGSGGVASAS